MYKKYINKFLVLFVALSLFGCKDFIEKDISGETPVLILPGNNSTINANPVHIKWEEMEGATKYRIEIVSPEFGSIQSFPLDSIVSGTNFFFGLDSAQYEMRITAMNAGFSSKPSAVKRFWVGTSQGGSNSVTLNTPDNEVYKNEDFDGFFDWNPITSTAVSSYTFELHKTSSFSGANVISPIDQLGITEITIPEANGSNLPEGPYCWGVKAYFTNEGETNWSKRIFYIDKTAPGMAVLTAPTNNFSTNPGPVNFTWTLPVQGTDQSPIESKIEIATDTGFANLIDSFNYSPNTSLSRTMTPGTYYWRVIVKDEAGNVSIPGASAYYTLTIF